jgi:hypothetical protein
MQVHLDEWVAPEIADEQGLLRAGKILESIGRDAADEES